MLKSSVWEAACISHEKAGIIGVAVVSLDCSRSPEFSGDPSTDIEIEAVWFVSNLPSF